MSQANDQDGPENGGTGRERLRTDRPSSLSLAIQQRKRSLSSASPLNHLNPNTLSPHRQRTNTGPMAHTGEVQRSLSYQSSHNSSKPSTSPSSRFVTSSSDFHLPQRAVTPTSALSSPYSPSMISPTSTAVLAAAATGEVSQNSSVNSLPLLRRKAAAAALAHASRKSLRRGSMLGKEVAKDGEEQTSSDEDEVMDEKGRVKHNGNGHSHEVDVEDQDDDMQIDTGDVTVSGVELERKGTDSHSPPSMTTSFGKSMGSTTNRRAVQRRANLMPRDRGVLRVAASLRDETRPGDGEIASEAKLQRRLGPESDSMAPTTPKLLASRSQSPFGATSAGIIDRGLDGDDFYFPDGAHFDMSDDSDYDGDDDMVSAKNNHYYTPEAECTDVDAETGIAIPGTDLGVSQKEKLWLSFRESNHHAAVNPRLSPGAERTMGRSRGYSVAPGTANATTPLSGSLGSVLDQAMDLEPYHHSGSSPSLWGKSAKRKIGDERFEPYYSSALHKRRAVSPIAFVTSNNNVTNRGRSCTPTSTLSPGLSGINQMSPLSIQVPHNNIMVTNLPTPTPLSIPSPTLSFTRGSGLSGSFPRSFPTLPMNRSGQSTNGSPSSTRPSTPTNQNPPPNPYGAGPSPSLLSSSASKAATLSTSTMGGTSGGGGSGNGGGGGGGGNGGSGPGYGSGALGLSLGGGSKRYKEEQEEKEEEEGMLGDVSAIKLGEL